MLTHSAHRAAAAYILYPSAVGSEANFNLIRPNLTALHKTGNCPRSKTNIRLKYLLRSLVPVSAGGIGIAEVQIYAALTEPGNRF
jgi:hypothetical protein